MKRSYLILSLCLTGSLAHAQQMRAVTPVNAKSASETVLEMLPPSANPDGKESVEGEMRNPFATASGASGQAARLVRESLNSTKILGILFTGDYRKMACIQVAGINNPLMVKEGSTFSVKVRGRDWRDVEVVDINKFEIKVAPKGEDGNITIR